MESFLADTPCPHCLGSGRTLSANSITSTVQQLLSSHGWSQADLARQLNVSQPFLSNCIAGNRKWPPTKLAALYALANPQTAHDLQTTV